LKAKNQSAISRQFLLSLNGPKKVAIVTPILSQLRCPPTFGITVIAHWRHGLRCKRVNMHCWAAEIISGAKKAQYLAVAVSRKTNSANNPRLKFDDLIARFSCVEDRFLRISGPYDRTYIPWARGKADHSIPFVEIGTKRTRRLKRGQL
jgi:hypothetical protein